MKALINEIIKFCRAAALIGLTGMTISLLACEIKLAALKKASHGSSKLSAFTQKMTGMNLNLR